jgi:endonuclease YncB( thermonuclease family)
MVFSVPASAENINYGNLICAEVTSIYDGDTFRCNIEGVHPLIGNRIAVRVNGVDTPEMNDKRPEVKALALKAKQFTVNKLRTGKVIELRNVQRGKYFRIVADVYCDGESLKEGLIKAGLGKNIMVVRKNNGQNSSLRVLIKTSHKELKMLSPRRYIIKISIKKFLAQMEATPIIRRQLRWEY